MHRVELDVIDRVDVTALPVALEREVLALPNAVLHMLHCYAALNGADEVACFVCRADDEITPTDGAWQAIQATHA
jgi:hypothetical protein